MNVTLIESKGLPPGGIMFHDPRIPGKVWNDTQASLAERVSQVVEFRKLNPRVYDPVKDAISLEPADVSREIVLFNYYRLGRTSAYFHVTDRPSAPASCCGQPLESRYCPSCSFKRLIGYRCAKCGKNYGL